MTSAPTARRLRLDQARRLALAAQGFDRPRPTGTVHAGHLRRTLDRMGLVQLDSVNVVTRSHHLPFFSRLGAYDRARLDDLLWRSGENFEYIGHEAAVLPVDLHPAMRHRMAGPRRWRDESRIEARHPGLLDAVLAQVAARGPITAAELENAGERTGSWWGHAPGKWALAALHAAGRVAVADRRTNFVIAFDLPERVLPAEVLATPTPDVHEATVVLVRRAVRALGVGTVADVADYHRQLQAPVRAALAELVAAGEVEQVEVDGWRDPAFRDPARPIPRRIDARALLSPFDPVVWFRPRGERLFDFHYRIEIYTPAPKRRFGYYVLPFLLGDRLVGRVDVKADRAHGVLRVHAAHLEPGVDRGPVVEPLAAELADLGAWLGCPEVAVSPRGETERALGAAVAGSA
ncbi:winged helix-turn-helix domain-containing protein [Actinomarinicola tropica]|uniref:Winged helix-turn-helix domain-containing protein n=1 Tax=Actinomarinicola tropica TaxID=2789776 RepID=A0A5Q2RIC6_9ACTN|nr:crosslink repair DNA glycosylase YcaQ family protein [Actinomarinicola tropica]QGG96618.1 winged helix-turn-helix domain-containing protein [Actinomarinicola tropica]